VCACFLNSIVAFYVMSGDSFFLALPAILASDSRWRWALT